MRSWLLFALIALFIALVALGGWLLSRDTQPPPSAAVTGVAQSTQIDDLQVTVRLDQAEIGTRVVEVAVRDAAGNPVELGAVQLRFSMTEMDMGTIETEARPVGQGQYQANGQFFTMAGNWQVDATLTRDQQPTLRASFQFPIAAPGEVSGPLNPFADNARAAIEGQLTYQANCVTCHGDRGLGDGPAASGLNPRPADFSQHMLPGRHTDGQVFTWIKNGFPGSAMPAFGSRFSDDQIWQLVTYLRTFGRSAPIAPPTPTALAAQALPPDVTEPLPPAAFTRQFNIWLSDGTEAAPRQVTEFDTNDSAEHPAFSPDGARIALVVIAPPPVDAAEPFPTSTLYTMNADGSNLQIAWQPERGIVSMPAWSGDGQSLYVAFNGLRTSADGGGSTRLLQIVRVDLATGAQQPILEDALDPTISRDGTQLAYLRLSQDGYTMSLEVAAPDGSGPRLVLDGAAFQGFYAPRFSPDGKQIVFAAIGGPETDPQGNPVTPGGRSPFERLLSLFEPATAAAHGMPWDLWVINTDGSGLRRLTSFYEDLPMAAFSPDGKQIVVLGSGGMYLMDADGSRLRRIDKIGDHGGIDWARQP